VLEAFGRQVNRFPRAFATLLLAHDFNQNPPVEIVVVGRDDDPKFEALQTIVARSYLPSAVRATLDLRQAPGAQTALTAGKSPVQGEAALYLCRNRTCEAPLTDPERVRHELSQAAAARNGSR
jgi:uncharacterized protein YyaL (SSP411 family)